MTDLYATLGVNRNARPETIRRRYRKLAKECHPDKCPGDAEAAARFKAIAQAFEILNDAAKRAHYDATGELPNTAHDDPLRAAALAELGGVYKGVIAGDLQTGRNPAARHVVNEMRTRLVSSKSAAAEELRKAEKLLGDLEALAPRCHSPDGTLEAIARCAIGGDRARHGRRPAADRAAR